MLESSNALHVTNLMRTTAYLINILIMIGALASCNSQPTSERVAPPISSASSPVTKQSSKIAKEKLEKTFHELVNRERLKRGLSTMRWDDALMRIARKHSYDMANRKYFSHTSPEGRGYAYRYRKNGYACGITVKGKIHIGAENIYQHVIEGPGDDFVELIMKGLMDDDHNRLNILSPIWSREGIGVSIGEDGMIYITQNFC
jgi:uncharacterized protein YkwD